MYETQFNSLLKLFGYELHRLRHTCATERLRAGMPLEAVQRLLGHATIQQTLGYAEIIARDVQKHAERSDEEFMRAVGKPKRGSGGSVRRRISINQPQPRHRKEPR
jgi:integrase